MCAAGWSIHYSGGAGTFHADGITMLSHDDFVLARKSDLPSQRRKPRGGQTTGTGGRAWCAMRKQEKNAVRRLPVDTEKALLHRGIL